jgi:hypothetical protein
MEALQHLIFEHRLSRYGEALVHCDIIQRIECVLAGDVNRLPLVEGALPASGAIH